MNVTVRNVDHQHAAHVGLRLGGVLREREPGRRDAPRRQRLRRDGLPDARSLPACDRGARARVGTHGARGRPARARRRATRQRRGERRRRARSARAGSRLPPDRGRAPGLRAGARLSAFRWRGDWRAPAAAHGPAWLPRGDRRRQRGDPRGAVARARRATALAGSTLWLLALLGRDPRLGCGRRARQPTASRRWFGPDRAAGARAPRRRAGRRCARWSSCRRC